MFCALDVFCTTIARTFHTCIALVTCRFPQHLPLLYIYIYIYIYVRSRVGRGLYGRRSHQTRHVVGIDETKYAIQSCDTIDGGAVVCIRSVCASRSRILRPRAQVCHDHTDLDWEYFDAMGPTIKKAALVQIADQDRTGQKRKVIFEERTNADDGSSSTGNCSYKRRATKKRDRDSSDDRKLCDIANDICRLLGRCHTL